MYKYDDALLCCNNLIGCCVSNKHVHHTTIVGLSDIIHELNSVVIIIKCNYVIIGVLDTLIVFPLDKY